MCGAQPHAAPVPSGASAPVSADTKQQDKAQFVAKFDEIIKELLADVSALGDYDESAIQYFREVCWCCSHLA